MERVLRQDPEHEEKARIREIVGRHPLPDFVESIDVQLGYFSGEPAAWIVFQLSGDDDIGLDELEKRAEIILPLQDVLHDELASAGVDRYPFFRVSYSHTPQQAG